MERAVAYLRVSTRQQQRSGLGIEAQRATIARFAQAENIQIIAEYVEAETGKGADALDRRPQLAAALAAAKAAKCCVLVSKLDRLSRDVAFVAGLMAQRVPFASGAFYRRELRPTNRMSSFTGLRPIREICKLEANSAEAAIKRAIRKTTVVHPRHAAWFIGQHWPDGTPLIV